MRENGPERGYLLSRCFQRGGGAGAQSASSWRATQLVVLEPQTKGARCPQLSASAAHLTTPDLVLLSLLAERPMHGYQANLELERREVRDWAAISKPQVYYSLEKLARLGLVRESRSDDAVAGPERQVYGTTPRGRAALAEALDREDWTNQRERPAFLTWMAFRGRLAPAFLPASFAAALHFCVKNSRASKPHSNQFFRKWDMSFTKRFGWSR